MGFGLGPVLRHERITTARRGRSITACDAAFAAGLTTWSIRRLRDTWGRG